MITIEQKLQNLAVSAAYDLSGWGGVKITAEKWLEVVKSQPAMLEYFQEEVDYPGAYETQSDHGLDTCVRDMAMDAVAYHATGRSWPTYSEGEEANLAFREALRNAFELEKKS